MAVSGDLTNVGQEVAFPSEPERRVGAAATGGEHSYRTRRQNAHLSTPTRYRLCGIKR